MSDRFGAIPVNSNRPSSPPPAEEDKSAPQKPSTPKKQRPNRILIFFFCTVFLVASYFLTALYLAPLLIHNYLQGYVRKTSGLELTIDTVQLNPLNFQLNLTDIEAVLPDESAPQSLLQIKSFFIDLDLTSLLRKSFVCEKLTVQGLELSIIRHKDKSYNLPTLSQFSSEQQQGAIINLATLPFLFSLNNIDISDSRILLDDQVTESQHTVENLRLAIPTLSNFSFQSDKYIQPHFSAIINGSTIELGGKAVQLADRKGFQTRLFCSIQELDLVPYFSYLPPAFPLTLSQGKADTSLEIAFSPQREQGSRLNIDIRMTAADLEMQGKTNDLQITLPGMEMEAVFAPISKRLHIKNITFKKIDLSGSKKTASDSFNTFLSLAQNNSQAHTEITIDQLLIAQGSVTLYGKTEKNRASSSWQALQLSMTDFSTTQPSGKLRIRGEHQGDGSNFTWQGAFTGPGEMQGRLQLNEFPAADLFPLLYSAAEDSLQGTAGFSGDLSFRVQQEEGVRYTLDDATLQILDLKISQGTNSWLEAGSLRFPHFSRTDDHYTLGKILLHNATLTLNSEKLPPLFSHLFIDTERPQIQGIDFSGDLIISNQKEQPAPLHLSDVQWEVSHLDAPVATNNLAFAGLLPGKGILKLKGSLNLGPARLDANGSFSNVDSSLLSPFLENRPLLSGSRATLHGEGTFRYPKGSFQGTLKLTNTLLQNEEEKPLFSWDQAEFGSLDCQFSPFSLQAESLHIDAPYFHWQHSSLSALQQFQNAAHTIFTNRSATDEKLFPLAIKKISFRNGTVTILDQRLSPPWQTTINTIEGRINNFDTSDDGLSSFTLTGTQEDSPLSLTGTAAFFHSPPEAHTRLNRTGFPLASFREQLIGSSIDPAQASVYLQMDMVQEQSHVSGTSEMIINGLVPTTARSDTALALALLKNTEDNFPLTLTMDDSEQSLFQKGLNAFQTILIKASYAPLLLDPTFSDLHDSMPIFFHPGSNTLSAAGKETLIRYGELLSRHLGLGLGITGTADGKMDREVLQTALEEKEQQRVDQENTQREAEYRSKQQHPPPAAGSTLQEENIAPQELEEYMALLPDPVHVTEEELLDLARERSLIVYDFCIHSLGLAAHRITIADRGEIVDPGPANGVRISIKTIPTNLN